MNTTTERFLHDVCPKCGTASQPAEQVPDQALRVCPGCGHDWFEDLSITPKAAAVVPLKTELPDNDDPSKPHDPGCARHMHGMAECTCSKADATAEPQHTPGPWTAEKMLIPPNAKDRRCGFVVNGPEPLPDRICDLRVPPGLRFREYQANARLIAAAPALLAALITASARLDEANRLLGVKPEADWFLQYRNEAMAAIALATKGAKI